MKYAFIVAASPNYDKGLTALKNSIRIHNNNADICVLEGKGVEDTAIERFNYACQVGMDYDAICLLDADMFLTANCDLWFKLAAKGFIVAGSNGMVINFNQEYQDKYKTSLNYDEYIDTKIHTSVPIFINKMDFDWFKLLYENKRVDHWDDFLYLNMLAIKTCKKDKMIVMPPYMFTGIHHWQMKPATAVFKRGDKLLSGTEEQVYMVHGKWWDPAWLQDLMPTMEKYLKDEMIGEKGKRIVENSINLLKGEFNRYLNGNITGKF